MILAYRHGMAVPCIEVKADLRVTTESDLISVDRFLIDSLQVPASDIDAQKKADPFTLPATRYVMRVLHAQAAMLRIGHLPIFSPGEVISIEQSNSDPQVWHTLLALSYIDEVPVSHLLTSFKLSAFILQKLNAGGSTLDRSRIDQLINQRIIRPLRSLAGAGVSTLPILRTATSLGIPVRHLGAGNYRLGWGANSRLFSRSAVDTDSAIGAELAQRKDSTTRMLAAAGLPCPVHTLVHSLEDAQCAAQNIGFPVVVKPADRERSEGVTTLVTDLTTLASAWQSAKKLSANVLVEQQVDGTCFRLMVANKKVLYVVERKPRSILGDGQSTIEQLLAADSQFQESAPMWLRKKKIPSDTETVSVLKRQGFNLQSVPTAQARVWLRHIESTEWGETTSDVTANVHTDNLDVAERAASALGLSNAGIDFITTDISRPWWETGGKLTEINFRPHFGGTVAAQQRMTSYLETLMPNQGRIPVYVYCGQENALEHARHRLATESTTGRFSVLCTADFMEGINGRIQVELPNSTPQSHKLHTMCRIALQDARVERLFVLVQDTGLLQSGLPFDRINGLHYFSSIQANHKDADLLLNRLRRVTDQRGGLA